MSDVFVDTSAIYAVLVAEDPEHAAAVAAIDALQTDRARLVTTGPVIGETVALLQRRAGVEAVRQYRNAIEPALEVTWGDRILYESAMGALLAAGRRDVSLVDWSSFAFMRAHGIREAFAFDEDFQAQGFTVVPGRRT